MSNALPYLLLAALALALTVLTQIGGVILVLAWAICRAALPQLGRRAALSGAAFVALYLGATLFVIPPLAAATGRVPLPCTGPGSLKSASVLYCALNRHYATPRLREMSDALAADVAEAYPGTVTLTLDASFPFLDGFPLLPHLSHDDGRKLDPAFYYAAPRGQYVPGKTRSPIGYFAFEQPRSEDPQPCAGRTDILTLRWDLEPLEGAFRHLALDEERTRFVLRWLAQEGRDFGVQKVFLEPHLVARLEVSSPRIRFQGCRAARHDDHIHVEIE